MLWRVEWGSSRTGYSGKLLGRSKMGRDEEQTAKTGQLGGSTPGEMLRTPARLLTLAQPSPASPHCGFFSAYS